MAPLNPNLEKLEPGPSDGDGMVPLECPESRAQEQLPAGKDQLQRASSDNRLQITSDEGQLPSLPDLWAWRVERGTEEVIEVAREEVAQSLFTKNIWCWVIQLDAKGRCICW